MTAPPCSPLLPPQTKVRTLRNQLAALEQEGEVWRDTAHKLDARARALDQQNRMIDQLQQESEFVDAVTLLSKKVNALASSLDSGHVDFSYVRRIKHGWGFVVGVLTVHVCHHHSSPSSRMMSKHAPCGC